MPFLSDRNHRKADSSIKGIVRRLAIDSYRAIGFVLDRGDTVAAYVIGKLVEIGILGQLSSDNGALPDFSRSIGSTGWGIGVRVEPSPNQGNSDYASVWAQPCVVANNPLSPISGESYLPIGGCGQLIIPGPTYVWSRRELGLDALAANSSAASQIDLGIALWRRRGRLFLNARVYRVAV